MGRQVYTDAHVQIASFHVNVNTEQIHVEFSTYVYVLLEFILTLYKTYVMQ